MESLFEYLCFFNFSIIACLEVSNSLSLIEKQHLRLKHMYTSFTLYSLKQQRKRHPETHRSQNLDQTVKLGGAESMFCYCTANVLPQKFSQTYFCVTFGCQTRKFVTRWLPFHVLRQTQIKLSNQAVLIKHDSRFSSAYFSTSDVFRNSFYCIVQL